MPNVPMLFVSSDVRRLVGVSQRQLAYWDKSRLVRPSGRPASGHGSRRLYTVLDVVRLKVIRRLLEAGVSLQKVRKALNLMAELPDEPAPFAELEVLTDGHRILVKRSNEQLLDPITRQLVLRLPLADLLAEVEGGVVAAPFAPSALRPREPLAVRSSG